MCTRLWTLRALRWMKSRLQPGHSHTKGLPRTPVSTSRLLLTCETHLSLEWMRRCRTRSLFLAKAFPHLRSARPSADDSRERWLGRTGADVRSLIVEGGDGRLGVAGFVVRVGHGELRVGAEASSSCKMERFVRRGRWRGKGEADGVVDTVEGKSR